MSKIGSESSRNSVSNEVDLSKFTMNACKIYSRLKRYKNYKNRVKIRQS